MFSQGSLLFVHDFDFTAINNSLSLLKTYQNKFLLILDKKGETILFCCFTTTLKKEADFHRIASIGCNKGHFPYNVFHFDNIKHVTDKNFKFNELTFIVGNKGQIFDYDLPKLYNDYSLQGKIEHKGNFDANVLCDILNCLTNSKTLEGDMREELFLLGDSIMENLQKKMK